MIGVHILIQLGLKGDAGSLGTVFLLRVIQDISKASCINHPLHFHTLTKTK